MTQELRAKKAYEENRPMSIGHCIGNSCWRHSAVRYPQDYTFEDFKVLWSEEDLLVDPETNEVEFLDDDFEED